MKRQTLSKLLPALARVCLWLSLLTALARSSAAQFITNSVTWDLGNGRHGSFILKTNATIEQLYATVRLTNDPVAYNPFDSNAIPHFVDFTVTNGATLTVSPWNGVSGGVLMLKVRGSFLVATGATIDVSGLGYRGGVGGYAAGNNGFQGESYVGLGSQTITNNLGGGSGGSHAWNNPSAPAGHGGGGGYGVPGSDGAGYNYSRAGAPMPGGIAYGDTNLATLFLGSGGGGGGGFGVSAYSWGGTGGGGGGAVALAAIRIRILGNIRANGLAGGFSDHDGGMGGGGSGGSILLRCIQGDLGSNTVTALGGVGVGGSGAIGRIKVESARGFTGVANPIAMVLISNGADTDGDGIPDSVEIGPDLDHPRDADMDGIPDFLDTDSDNDGIPDSIERGADGNNPRDTDGDGIPDYRDTDSDNDGIPDSIEALPDPMNPRDSDGNGIPDYRQFDADLDGDWIYDSWEVAHGLNPHVSDAALDYDQDGLSNYQEFIFSITNAAHIALDPRNPFSIDGSMTDAQFVNGLRATRYTYDRSDRLIGAEYQNGTGSAWFYDGNGNLLRQFTFNRYQNADGLPALWKVLNGLNPTNSAGTNGLYADADGDGWSNYQEWLAGSNPNNALSVPITNIIQTAPLAEIQSIPNQGVGLAVVRVMIWDGEGNNALPFLQYSNAATLGWSNATLTQVDGTNLAALVRGVSAPPTGAAHQVVWNTTVDLGPIGANVLLRARAQDQTSTNLFGAWSAAMPYTVLPNPDSDGDGMPDAWENQYFGNLSHNSLTDSDGDGFTDLQEYIADTNPTNNLSYLHFSSVHAVPGGLSIQWQGGVLATQFLQQRFSLNPTSLWTEIFTNLPPTPDPSGFTNYGLTNNAGFYRVRVTR